MLPVSNYDFAPLQIYQSLLPEDRLRDDLDPLKLTNGSRLPPLNKQQLKELNTFLDTPRFTLNFSIRSFIDEILSELGSRVKVEIIGGYAREIIRKSKKYCEKALGTRLEDSLFNKEWEKPSDWDIKITGVEELSVAMNTVLDLLRAKGKFTLLKKKIVKSSFAIIHYEGLEILLVKSQKRDRIFEHERIKLPFPLGEVEGSLQTVAHLLTRTLLISENEHPVNENGWPRLISCKIRGYRSQATGTEKQLFEISKGDEENGDILDGKLFHLLWRQVENHHFNDLDAATALFFQASYSVKNSEKLWQNFGALTRMPNVELKEGTEQTPLRAIRKLLLKEPSGFTALASLLEIIGFCCLNQGVFTETKDEGKPAIRMSLPSNYTLLFPLHPIEALDQLSKRKVKLEKNLLLFFRKMVEMGKENPSQRSLPDNVLEKGKQFLKSDRELIRGIGFELLLSAEECSPTGQHLPQLVYELCKRNHTDIRVERLLGEPLNLSDHHSPKEQVLTLTETKNIACLKVGCQLWNTLTEQSRFSTGIPLCRSLIIADTPLALKIFQRLTKLNNREIVQLTQLFQSFVNTLTDAELAYALPTLKEISSTLLEMHPPEDFVNTLYTLQGRFPKAFKTSLLDIEQEWRCFQTERSPLETRLAEMHRFVTHPRFPEVSVSPNKVYVEFLSACTSAGVMKNRSMIIQVLSLLIKNSGDPLQIYHVLSALWHPQHSIPKKLQKDLDEAAPGIMRRLRDNNLPEELCQFTILLENYGINTKRIGEHLLWALPKIGSSKLRTRILNLLIRNPNIKGDQVVDVALKVDNIPLALRHLDKTRFDQLKKIAAKDFDAAYDFCKENGMTEEMVSTLAPYVETSSPNRVAELILEYNLQKPVKLNHLILELGKSDQSTDLWKAFELMNKFNLVDARLWPYLIERAIDFVLEDGLLLQSATNTLITLIQNCEASMYCEVLRLGVHCATTIDKLPPSDELSLQLSLLTATLEHVFPSIPDSIHVIQVRSLLRAAVISKDIDEITACLGIFHEKRSRVGSSCEKEVMDALVQLTLSVDGMKLFEQTLPILLQHVNEEDAEKFLIQVIEKMIKSGEQKELLLDMHRLEFITQSLSALLDNCRFPILNELIIKGMFYIRPQGDGIYVKQVEYSKLLVQKAAEKGLLTEEHLAKAMLYLEHKVVASPTVTSRVQKRILTELLNELIGHKSGMSLFVAVNVFRASQGLICLQERNLKKFDYIFLLNSYKKIIDGFTEFPYAMANNVYLADHVISLLYNHEKYLALDGSKEGVQCAFNATTYTFDKYHQLFTKYDAKRAGKVPKHVFLQGVIRMLRVGESRNIFENKYNKYFELVRKSLPLLNLKELPPNETRDVPLLVDLVMLKLPYSDLFFRKLSKKEKTLQIETLEMLLSSHHPKHKKQIQQRLTPLLNFELFFKNHSGAQKKVKAFLA